MLRQVGVQEFCEAVGQGGLRLGFAGVVGVGDLAAHVGVGDDAADAAGRGRRLGGGGGVGGYVYNQ